MPAQPVVSVVPAGLRRALGRASVVALLAGTASSALLLRDAAPEPAAAPAVPRAVVLSGSSLSYADAQATADLLGWEATAYALPGVGLSRSTLDTVPSLVRSARDLLQPGGADVVVLQGGEADHAAPLATLEAAARSLLQDVQDRVGPEAEVVLVGPIPGATAPASLRRVDEVLRGVAEQAGVPYVDALAEGWQVGADVPERLADALRRAGVAGG